MGCIHCLGPQRIVPENSGPPLILFNRFEEEEESKDQDSKKVLKKASEILYVTPSILEAMKKRKLKNLLRDKDAIEELEFQLQELEYFTQKQLKDFLTSPNKFIYIGGSLALKIQHGFESKICRIISEGFYEENVNGMGLAYSCKKGVKSTPNQDDFFILIDGNTKIFGVFDGHGVFGHYCSNFIQQIFPKILLKNANYKNNIQLALTQSFTKSHEALYNICEQKSKFSCNLSGSTATIIVHRNDTIYVAHVGDSRCILVHNNMSNSSSSLNSSSTQNLEKFTALTRDHSPNIDEERTRINNAGGEVRKTDNKSPFRVFAKEQNYPGLAMSRALGDVVCREFGIICEPDIRSYEIRKDRDLAIIVATDGVWEFMENSDVADIVLKKGKKKCKQACEQITENSFNKWLENEGNTVDDITCVAYYFS